MRSPSDEKEAKSLLLLRFGFAGFLALRSGFLRGHPYFTTFHALRDLTVALPWPTPAMPTNLVTDVRRTKCSRGDPFPTPPRPPDRLNDSGLPFVWPYYAMEND